MDDRKNLFSRLMSDELLAPEISGVYLHTFNPGHNMEPHSHNTVEVISALHGSSFLTFDKQQVKIRKNECLIIFPNVRHGFFLNNSESCRLMNIHFNPGKVVDLLTLDKLQYELRFFYELKTNNMSYMKLMDNSIVKDVSHRIIKEVENKGEYSEDLIRLYFCELYIRLSQIMSDTVGIMSKPLSSYLKLAVEFINNFYNENISVQSAALHSGISQRHLSRLFVTELGITVQDYINALRIKKAKEFLERSSLDITHIAHSLGFSSSQYFSTCFKRSEAITPKEYRKMINDRISNKYE